MEKQPDKFDDHYKRPVGPRGPKILSSKKPAKSPLVLPESTNKKAKKKESLTTRKKDKSTEGKIDTDLHPGRLILVILLYIIGSFGGNDFSDMTIILKILFWPLAIFMHIGILLPVIRSFRSKK